MATGINLLCHRAELSGLQSCFLSSHYICLWHVPHTCHFGDWPIAGSAWKTITGACISNWTGCRHIFALTPVQLNCFHWACCTSCGCARPHRLLFMGKLEMWNRWHWVADFLTQLAEGKCFWMAHANTLWASECCPDLLGCCNICLQV